MREEEEEEAEGGGHKHKGASIVLGRKSHAGAMEAGKNNDGGCVC